ncbi:MFS transporter [Bacillus songklensis]|uniref:MFS transporter n=1 Tax=Bacillus songklensis TaxID=1069116 RepID=A0ABV8AZL5_9BACI
MKRNQSEDLMIITSTLNNLGNAITWTGLPILALELTGSYIFTGVLYYTETISRILVTIFGGSIIDKLSKKLILKLCLLSNFFLMILIYLVILNHLFFLLFPFMIISQSLGALAYLAEDTWYKQINEKQNLVQKIGKLNTYVMTTKTLGFTLGPLIFGLLGTHALILDALTFLISFYLVKLISYTSLKGSSRQGTVNDFLFRYRNILSNGLINKYLIVAALGGMITPVITSLSIFILKDIYNISDTNLSLFWLVAGIGAVTSNFAISRYKMTDLSNTVLLLLSVSLIVGGIFLMTISPNPFIYIIGFTLLTLGNPIINNMLSFQAFKSSEGQEKGSVNGLMIGMYDIGTLIFMPLSWSLLNKFGVTWTCLTILIIALVRILIFYYPLRNITIVENKESMNLDK